MSYRDKIEKEFTLPSGSKIRIDRLNVLNQPFTDKRASEDPSAYSFRLALFILCNKTGPIDGQFRIVEDGKVTDRNTEIAVGQLVQEDADFIVKSCLDFSGFGAAEEAARKTFPEAVAQDGSGSASTGGTLRAASNGVAEAACG